mmetsp:Transcript_19389/g.47411  ORF Transcript_19389/g.47411 Transcript_19389/m.47411 type:complete len:167 (-) Transcript_19389:135-635(-)
MENGNWDQITGVLDSQSEATDETWEWHGDLDTEEALQRKLNWMLCVYIPISMLAIFAIGVLTVDTQTDHRPYSMIITGSYNKYSVFYDIFGFWYIILVYLFLVYYAYIPRNWCKSEIRSTTLKKKSVAGNYFAADGKESGRSYRSSSEFKAIGTGCNSARDSVDSD